MKETWRMTAINLEYEFLDPPQREGEIGRLGPYRVLGLLGKGGSAETRHEGNE